MVLVDYLAGEFVYTEKLNVPQGLTVSVATQPVESWDWTVFAHSAIKHDLGLTCMHSSQTKQARLAHYASKSRTYMHSRM